MWQVDKMIGKVVEYMKQVAGKMAHEEVNVDNIPQWYLSECLVDIDKATQADMYEAYSKIVHLCKELLTASGAISSRMNPDITNDFVEFIDDVRILSYEDFLIALLGNRSRFKGYKKTFEAIVDDDSLFLGRLLQIVDYCNYIENSLPHGFRDNLTILNFSVRDLQNMLLTAQGVDQEIQVLQNRLSTVSEEVRVKQQRMSQIQKLADEEVYSKLKGQAVVVREQRDKLEDEMFNFMRAMKFDLDSLYDINSSMQLLEQLRKFQRIYQAPEKYFDNVTFEEVRYLSEWVQNAVHKKTVRVPQNSKLPTLLHLDYDWLVRIQRDMRDLRAKELSITEASNRNKHVSKLEDMEYRLGHFRKQQKLLQEKLEECEEKFSKLSSQITRQQDNLQKHVASTISQKQVRVRMVAND